MIRPHPGSFHGSMPSPDFSGARHARRMDLCFSGLALLACTGVWLGAAYGGPGADIVGLTKLSCAAVLVSAATGMWVIQRATSVPRLAVTPLVQAVRRRLTGQAFRQAVILAPHEMPAHGLTGLAEDLKAWLQRQPGNQASPEAASAHSWEQAQQIMTDLYREADFLGEASHGITDEDRHLTGELGKAGAACKTMQTALAQLTDRVVSLTEAVGGTTAEAQRVVSLSVGLSEQAFAGQLHVAGLDDQSATLQLGAEQVESLLLRLDRFGAGTDALPAVLAADLQSLAAGVRQTIGGLQANLAEMADQARSAALTACELGERVKGQHDLGLGLAHAVTQQGEEVGEILRILAEAQTGFVTLRDSVEAVTRHSPARTAKAEQIRKAAARLPTHAETLASVLRSLPDFAPPIEYEL